MNLIQLNAKKIYCYLKAKKHIFRLMLEQGKKHISEIFDFIFFLEHILPHRFTSGFYFYFIYWKLVYDLAINLYINMLITRFIAFEKVTRNNLSTFFENVFQRFPFKKKSKISQLYFQ